MSYKTQAKRPTADHIYIYKNIQNITTSEFGIWNTTSTKKKINCAVGSSSSVVGNANSWIPAQISAKCIPQS